jgi:aminomethyltransferase
MANRTPLYDWHAAHGARLVDFAGWDMPIQYTSIIEEHQAVRTGAGLFDISHMGRLSLGGPDTLALIQLVFTNNAATMNDLQVRYGLVCNEQGGIRDDVLVYRWPYGYAMVVNASNREKIVDWLARHKGDRHVEVADRTFETCMIAVQGPKAVAMCRGLTEADPGALTYYYATPTRYQDRPCVVSRTGYTGEDGLEIIVAKDQGVPLWEELLARGARPCGLGARDTLRLEAAMPLYGHELSEEIDPLQAGLGWAVKLDKGEFIAREGAAVTAAGKEVGRVTSGTFGPTLGKALAMAYVDPGYTKAGTECAVDVRGKAEPARVVPLPFYRRPKT